MVNKFIIAIAGVVAVMIALMALPRMASQPAELEQNLVIEYGRQDLARIEDGRLVAASAEDLVIRNDGAATYRNLTGLPGEKTFTVSVEEMNRLKGLILGTGFMQVDGTNYPQEDGLSNLTKYTLRLESNGVSKNISWFNLEASETTVPSIVRNIGDQLDAIIERYV